MTHTTSRPYSGLGHLGNTRPGLSKIWLKYAFYLLTNFWTQTYGKVFVFCQHSSLYTRLQHSTTQPPVLLVFLPLECRHVPVHRAPACAPLMQHSWSAGRREEGGGGTPTLAAAAADYNGRRCWAPDPSSQLTRVMIHLPITAVKLH